MKKAKWLGVVAGLLNGLFGAGGGMLLVPALAADGLDQHKAQATALMALIPLSAFSLISYLIAGNVSSEAVWVVCGALPGGYVGAKLMGMLPAVWLSRLFAAFMAIAGVRQCFFG